MTPSAGRPGASPARLSFGPCDCPTSSSRRSATTRRCRDAVASAPAARRLHPPARLRHLLAPAARQARQRPRRADHPRGAGPDRRPGDGDAGRPSGRRLAGERPLRRDRPGAGPVQGPQRAGHGPRDDPRGGRRAAARRHREVVPPAADAGLPLPDEVARRAAVPRRPDPRPRVRDEGRLQLRPRRGRARRQLLGAARRLRPDLRAARPRDDRGQLRRRDDGRHPGPRVHGPQPRRRGRPRPVRGVRLRREPPGRGHAEARARRRGGPPARGGRHARARPRSPRSRRSSGSTRRGRPRPPSSSPATAAS